MGKKVAISRGYWICWTLAYRDDTNLKYEIIALSRRKVDVKDIDVHWRVVDLFSISSSIEAPARCRLCGVFGTLYAAVD